MFPQGLPNEFALVLTLLLKKRTHQNTWYLFQVTDEDGYPQVSPTPTLIALRALSSTSPVQFLCQFGISGASLLHLCARPRGHPYPISIYLILSGHPALRPQAVFFPFQASVSPPIK